MGKKNGLTEKDMRLSPKTAGMVAKITFTKSDTMCGLWYANQDIDAWEIGFKVLELIPGTISDMSVMVHLFRSITGREFRKHSEDDEIIVYLREDWDHYGTKTRM